MKKILLLVAVSFLAVACDKENKNIFDNVKEATGDTKLQGKSFQSECSTEVGDFLQSLIAGAFGNTIKSSRTEYKFEGANVTRNTMLYNQLACAGEAYTYSETGEFERHEDNGTTDGGTQVDFKFTKLTLKMDSEPGVTAAKAQALCGISEWSKDQEQDITAQSADAACWGSAVPRVNLNVYRMDGDNVLVLGDAGDSTSQTRPTSVSVQYTAQ